MIRWRSWHRRSTICLLACTYLAVTTAAWGYAYHIDVKWNWRGTSDTGGCVGQSTMTISGALASDPASLRSLSGTGTEDTESGFGPQSSPARIRGEITHAGTLEFWVYPSLNPVLIGGGQYGVGGFADHAELSVNGGTTTSPMFFLDLTGVSQTSKYCGTAAAAATPMP